jgi:hypothetical protein
LNTITKELADAGLTVNENGHIMYKHTDGKTYDINYFKFLQNLDKDDGTLIRTLGDIDLEYNDNTKFVDLQLFKDLLEKMIDKKMKDYVTEAVQ